MQSCFSTYFVVKSSCSLFFLNFVFIVYVFSFFFFRLWNSCLSGVPDNLLHKLQKVHNYAARLIFRAPKQTPTTPLLKELHRLLTVQSIDYKIAWLCTNVFNQTAPQYLTDTVTVYNPSRTLRSSSDTRLLKTPRCNKKTQGQRSFCYYPPSLWNTLPFSVRRSSTP